MLELNFHPFPELETDRLILRSMSEQDAKEIFFLRSDQAVLQYLGKEPAKNVQAAKDFIKLICENIDNNEAIMWGIALKENPDLLIGTICLWQIQKEHYRAAIGYALHPAHWKKGLMKEAIRAVIDYAFDKLGFHSLEAHIHPGNKASAASLQTAGFVREGYYKQNFYFKGEFSDTAVYSLINPKK